MTSDSILYLPFFYLTNVVDGRIGLALLVLGMLGLVSWWLEGERRRVVTFGGAVVALLALWAAGSLWSVTRTLEPLRFMASLDLLLTIPAGSWLVRAASWLAHR